MIETLNNFNSHPIHNCVQSIPSDKCSSMSSMVKFDMLHRSCMDLDDIDRSLRSRSRKKAI